MHLSPDELIFWQFGLFKLNATVVMTWIVMAVPEIFKLVVA